MKNLESTLKFLKAQLKEADKKFNESNRVDNRTREYDFSGIIGNLTALVQIAIRDIEMELEK